MKFNYILNLEGFDSYVSRKFCKTKTSNTLKYDIKIRRNSFELFNRKIARFITHPKKLRKIKKFHNKMVKAKNIEKEALLPELNIGLVGH